MQVCTSLQTDNYANTPPLSFLQTGCPSCCPTNSVKALKVSNETYNLKSVNQYSLCPAVGSVVAVCRAVRRGGCCAGCRSWWSRRDLRRKRERNRNSSSARSNDVCTAKRWLKSNRSTYVGATCDCLLAGALCKGVRRVLVTGVNAPLPPEAKKI